ncbi:MAG: HAMP domain-containing histidine kinase [Rhizobiaceae bacterium]|nr:HAMP domain-containing histidine kinase [Rhizobiaceae bacterium]
MVHPAIVDAAERDVHRRLIGVLLAAPFFLAAAAAQVLFDDLGAGRTLALVSATFGLSWLAALIAASTAHDRLSAGLGLAVTAAASAAVVAGAGGFGSPLMLLAFALPLEAAWIYRSRNAAIGGLCALGAALSAVYAATGLLEGSVDAAQWLVPLAYAGALVLRLVPFAQPVRDEQPQAKVLGDLLLASSVVFELDKGGDVRSVSGRAADLFGLSEGLLHGPGLFDRIHVSDRVHFLCALADARAGLRPAAVDVRLRVPGASGDGFRLFAAELVQTASGDAMAILRDRSDVAGLRQALVDAEDKAAELDVAKSRFLAGVSHELRTPLNAIIGFSDMLLHGVTGPLPDAQQQEYIELIRESGNHLLEVVNSVLDVSKVESGAYTIHAEPFRFAEAVAMSRSMMELQAARKSVTIEQDLAANLGEIHADRRAVHQILINLVSNAVKFTPSGGKVTIGAKRLGTRLHFWVSDNGIGIAEADMDRLGQPFMQVQNDYTRQFEGTGLGLSLVKGLVALHDGTMSIESALGEGTTVSISLPVFGPKRRSDRPRHIASSSHGEDDAAIRKAG